MPRLWLGILAASRALAAPRDRDPELGGLDDSTAAVQAAVRTHGRAQASATSGAGLSRYDALAAAATSAASRATVLADVPFCERFPGLCREPFRCHTRNPLDGLQWAVKGWAHKGHSNPEAWCVVTKHYEYVNECLGNRNPVKAAHLMRDKAEAGYMGRFNMELDASYCFLEGFCSDAEITNASTLEDGERVCNDRFGNARWTQVGSFKQPKSDRVGTPIEEEGRNGFLNRNQTIPYVLLACALGNFHCDVMYCKETYCKEEYYVNKYGRFQRDYGWTI